ncbi:unannotated protein [freshwater metagenome]|uniref:Unannotated protein n=1 Tax=freshwater metagenome TaxID=449393 RepID=A0A6J6AIJ0_9ZZZZ
MMSSTIIPSANPPEKHIPIAPTPLPPISLCREPARARSQEIIGDVFCNANVVNSFATQIFNIDDAMYLPLTACPGVPTRSGMTTVKSALTTSFAKRSTAGVMPGISWTTMTTGPVPFR